VKNWRSDETVVVGFTKGKEARVATFGSLILMQKDRDGKWRYIGKASGFDEETMKRLLQRMRRLKTDRQPVKNADKVDNVKARVNRKLSSESNTTREARTAFRFPDFLQVRIDKKPEEYRLKV